MNLKFATDKLALLLALVPYLDEVRVVSVDEAAEHFKVTPSDIRQAVSLIGVSGVPTVDHIPLPNDMFDIDWDAFLEEDVIVLTQTVVIDETLRFSVREASALIAGLQYLAALPGAADNDVLLGLINKLSDAAIGQTYLVTDTPASDEVRDEITKAINEERQLTFVYASADGRSELRTVDPLLVQAESGIWYLRGWCHERDAMRVFRFDRMSDVTASDEPMARSLESLTLPDSLFDEGADDFDVIVEVTRSAIPLLGDYIRGADVPSSGDPVRMNVRVAHVHGLKRVIVAHPEAMRVIAPESAARAVADWASQALSQYSDTPPAIKID